MPAKWRMKKSASSGKLPQLELVRVWRTRQFTVELRYQHAWHGEHWRADVLMRGRSMTTHSSDIPGVSAVMAIIKARQQLMWPQRHYNRRMNMAMPNLLKRRVIDRIEFPS
jgi:hypothetical protein